MSDIPAEAQKDEGQPIFGGPFGLSNWLWRPWYAKIWWAAIPAYWLAMGEPTRPSFLDAFADSGYAIITNIAFIPITALVVLGAGFVRQAAIDGRLGPPQADRMFPGHRPKDDVAWNSLQNPNRFRNAVIREHMKR